MPVSLTKSSPEVWDKRLTIRLVAGQPQYDFTVRDGESMLTIPEFNRMLRNMSNQYRIYQREQVVASRVRSSKGKVPDASPTT